jgi:uncharacterized delta-60 repeat protein
MRIARLLGGAALASAGALMAASLAAGALDTTFDGDGHALVDLGSSAEVAKAVAIQPDGKIVVGGYSHDGSKYNFALTRVDASGALDTSFGTGGKVKHALSASQNIINDIALQPDGKIVAVGDSPDQSNDTIVLRYLADGSLDPSFDGDGWVRVPFGTSGPAAANSDFANAVAIQNDGKIVVAGTFRFGGIIGTGEIAVARLDSDGSLDSTFSGDGKTLVDLSGTDDSGEDVALQSDGKIVVTGSSGPLGGARDLGLGRLNPDGSLDSSFGTGGKVVTDVNFLDFANALAIDGAGRIAVAGLTTTAFGSCCANSIVARYTSAGALDTSFDSDGHKVIDLGSGSESAQSVIAAGDRLLVAGSTFTSTRDDMAFVRLNGDGTLDTSFDGDGKQVVDLTPGFRSDQLFDAALDAAGRLIAVGSSFSTVGDFAIIRLADVTGVEDTTPPIIVAPADVQVSNDPGSCAAGAAVGTPTASDDIGVASITVTRSDGLGVAAAYPVGTTTLTWRATDVAGNFATDTQTITVADAEPPAIVAPGNVVAGTDPGVATAAVPVGTPTTSDNCAGAVTVSAARSDGQALSDPYPLGTTVVIWTAADAAGNSASATQTIEVVDDEAPAVTCPADMSVDAVGTSGAAVTFPAATAVDNVGVASLVYSLSSGTTLAIGSHTINATATDAAGNASSCTFAITVNGAAAQLADAQDIVDGMNLHGGTANSLNSKLQSALAAFNAGDIATACGDLKAFLNQVDAQDGKKLSASQAAALRAEADRIRAVIGCPS